MFDTVPGDAFGGAGFGASNDDSLGFGGGSLSAAPAASDAFAPLSPEDSTRFAREFQQCRGPDGFVLEDVGRRLLERKGLAQQTLETIWRLSDLDRDGRLSLREFVCAVHLAEISRSGRALPVEVTVAQQTELVRSVRGDDAFSTADTAASLAPIRRRAEEEGVDFGSADFSSHASRLASGLFATHAGSTAAASRTSRRARRRARASGSSPPSSRSSRGWTPAGS